MADFKRYLFNGQNRIVKRCDLAGDDLDRVVGDARIALRQEPVAARFEIWQGARLLYSEHALGGQRAAYPATS